VGPDRGRSRRARPLRHVQQFERDGLHICRAAYDTPTGFRAYAADPREVDAALLAHTAGYERIAADFGLSYSGLRRHERAHLADWLRRYKETQMLMPTFRSLMR
jgi:hypothetical protein